MADVMADPKCKQCGGTGVIRANHPTTYETATAEERALACDMAGRPCPDCADKQWRMDAAPELLASLKEMRQVCAACFEVIGVAGAIDLLDAELTRIGIKEGFGTRSSAAIAKAEGR